MSELKAILFYTVAPHANYRKKEMSWSYRIRTQQTTLTSRSNSPPITFWVRPTRVLDSTMLPSPASRGNSSFAGSFRTKFRTLTALKGCHQNSKPMRASRNPTFTLGKPPRQNTTLRGTLAASMRHPFPHSRKSIKRSIKINSMP